jgi:hypothetical protein
MYTIFHRPTHGKHVNTPLRITKLVRFEIQIIKYVNEKNLPIFHIDSSFDTSLINDSLSNIFDNF